MSYTNPIILILEDDPIQLKMMESILQKDYPSQNIYGFTHPLQALDFLKTTAVDLIILDIYLPVMNGFEFFDNMNKMLDVIGNKQKPYIINCTAAEDKEMRTIAFSKGIMDYIIKPFTFEEFSIRIKRVLDFKMMQEKILQFENSALKDPLSGLWNRKALDEELERIAQLSKRYNMEYSVMLIDIDKMKRYNDIYGFSEGDKIIHKVGEIILKNLRKSDFAGRFNGEEFLIILPYTDETGSFTVGWRLLKDMIDIAIPFPDNLPYQVATFSCGISVKEKEDDIITVIKKADEALYFGKKYNRKVISFSELLKKG